MPWKELSVVSNRNEFVRLASAEGANVSERARRFGVSPTTAYKWLDRYRADGTAGLLERSRAPRTAPGKTSEAVERAVVSAQRFEYPTPNALGQMDFKGHFAIGAGRCHPLTILDDHARYSLGLCAWADQKNLTVRGHLIEVFRRFGRPERILCDNGAPGGSVESDYTQLGVWLLRLVVRVCHGRPYHPQTQGTDERFHRTRAVEVLQGRTFSDLAAGPRGFDTWREVYNTQRPHEALGLDVPASRYRARPRNFPEALPLIEYHEHEEIRRVQVDGRINYRDRAWKVGKGFAKQRVAIRPTTEDGLFNVYFATIAVAPIDLRENND